MNGEKEIGGKPAISFGFKRKIETKVDESKVVKENNNEIEKEFVNDIDEEVLKKKSEGKKELIIPLIQKNRWMKPQIDSLNETCNESDLQAEAVREILKESEEFMEKKVNEDENNDNFESLAVPLLLKNKVPDGFETDEKLNVTLRPDEASLANYDEIPIQAFGMAMLRGMGWDPNIGIGRTFKQNVKMLETNVRPKGLGLGASAPIRGGNSENKSNKSGKEETLEVKKGLFVLVQSGSHRRKYGIVEGLEPDNAQCIVKFALDKKTATIGEHCLKPVSKSEYTNNAKDLSRLSKAHKDYKDENRGGNPKKDYENLKKKEEKMMKKRKNKNCDDEAVVAKSSDEHSLHKKHKKMKSHKYEEKEKHRSKKRSGQDESSKHAKKYQRRLSDGDEDPKNIKIKKKKRMWLRQNLRVRMVDEKYRRGKYYRNKLLVVDVLDAIGHCCCKTDDGLVLDDIHEDMLETVVPRSNSEAYVIVTSRGRSQHDGKLAKILEKDKEASEAYLQLIEDRDVVIRVSFDEMCEFVGDVESHHFF